MDSQGLILGRSWPLPGRRIGLPLLFALVACLALPQRLLAAELAPIPSPIPVRAQQLVHLVRQDCGSCHGLTLRGGLGPALTAPALAEKPPSSLEATILHGRPGTPMPPFAGLLSEDEVRWIVARLRAGFPEQ